jgi:ABC-type sugar transport system substrate-binding protein
MGVSIRFLYHHAGAFNPMFRCFSRAFVVAVLFAWAVPGCDPAGSMPGASPDGGPDPAREVQEPLRAIKLVLVLDSSRSPDQIIWEQVALKDAGRAAAMLEVVAPKPDDPAARQAELVREAVLHRASALLVVAQDPPSLAPALSEARDKGVPVILLERPVPSTGKPFLMVTRPPYLKLARELIDAAVAEAKAVGLPTDGPALLLVDNRNDDQTNARVEALKTALAERGVKLVDAVVFGEDPSNPDSTLAQKVVEQVTASKGPLAMVVAEDAVGLGGGSSARTPLGIKGEYVLVGLSIDHASEGLTTYQDCAAVGYLNPADVARQAVALAMRVLRGEKVPERTEVPFTLFRSKAPRPPGGSPYMRQTRPGPA